MHVDLGEGQSAEIIEAKDLRSGVRRAVNRAINFSYDDAGRPIIRAADLGSGPLSQQADELLKHVIQAWSLPFPVPSQDPDSLDKLSLDQDDKLREAIIPHLDLLNGRVDPGKKDTDPTEGSSSSSDTSQAADTTQS